MIERALQLLRQIVSQSLPVLEEAKPDPERELRIFIDLRSERLLVGTLTFEEPFWVFRYSEAFAARDEIPPISAFPDKTKAYKSRDLWTFFRVRVPPPPRDDVRSAMEERGISSSDIFGLLGFLGRRTPTSPYEFELGAPLTAA